MSLARHIIFGWFPGGDNHVPQANMDLDSEVKFTEDPETQAPSGGLVGSMQKSRQSGKHRLNTQKTKRYASVTCQSESFYFLFFFSILLRLTKITLLIKNLII